ncbi:hypothetical protein SDC9_110550 [bioreactor metagenome]|uniref:Uncharacterized protein n=1 Tax=bioreactor metagenome TaxID=1076179 RepID=A0A645BDW2_9ZZZZ
MAPVDSIFLLFCQQPSDIYSLCEHAGMEGSFKMNLKKKFDYTEHAVEQSSSQNDGS